MINMNKEQAKGVFSHKSDHWRTPSKIYKDFIDAGYYDPCPYMADFDGLKTEWGKKVFINPPYSDIKTWAAEAIKRHKEDPHKMIVMLVPARTDTKWFRALYEYGCDFYFETGRLHFNDSKNGAPFPSVFISLIGKESTMLFF